MGTYAVATTTASFTMPCPVCGEAVRGELRRSSSASVGFFENPTTDAAKAAAGRDARAQVDALVGRITAGDTALLRDRSGIELRCRCGYESAASTFAKYFVLLAAGLILAFVGVGVFILVGGTIWYLRRRAGMDRRLALAVDRAARRAAASLG